MPENNNLENNNEIGTTNNNSGINPQSFTNTNNLNNNNVHNNQTDSTKKLVDTAAKGAAEYFAPGVGSKVYDAAKNMPVIGNAIDQKINDVANVVNKNPLAKNAAKKLDNSGMIDGASNAISAIGGSKGGQNKFANASPSTPATPNGLGNRSSNTGFNQAMLNSNVNDISNAESTQSDLPQVNSNATSNRSSLTDNILNSDSGSSNSSGSGDIMGNLTKSYFQKHKLIIIASCSGIAFFVLILFVILGGGVQATNSGTLGLYGYEYIELENACNEVYVYNTEDNKYDGTYDLETYVAGVVYNEVGVFNNETMFEIAAITARTYALRRMDESCSIEGNQNAQVFRTTTNELATEAANNTKGLVLTRNNSLISTEYDAFCWDEKDDNYYYLCQKNYDTEESLKIPIDWANEYVKKFSGQSFLDNERYRSHGRGMSQNGAYYLVTEKQYTADNVLKYFYGSDTELKSIYRSTIKGDYPIDPNDERYQNLEFLLNNSFEDLLAYNGSSVELLNQYLQDVVIESGVGTREAVVNVAVSLIGSIADMGYKLNYNWGGKYYFKGVNNNWGNITNMTEICKSYKQTYGNDYKCLNSYKWSSFDCSGFVNWAFINGFQFDNFNELRENGMYSADDKYKKIELDSNNAVCYPGDVLESTGHIVLVVGIDYENNRYIVAESRGSDLNAKTGGLVLSYYKFNQTGYVCGSYEQFYNNDSNEEE